MAECQYEVAVFAESEFGEHGFNSGDVNYLAEILRKTFDQLVKEDVVSQAFALIDAGIEQIASGVRHSPGFVPNSAQALGIRALPPQKKAKNEKPE